jgi:hypothetical protein
MASTAEGIAIDRSDEQFTNASSPRIETRHPGSNDNCERLLQLAKQKFSIFAIEEGMQID